MSDRSRARRTGLRATLLAATILAAAAPLQAQGFRTVDRLLETTGLGSSAPMVDLETRASKRYAVVIGNGDYAAIPDLANAQNDARVMAEFLRDQGYLVNSYIDITKRGFEDMLRRVLFDVDKDTEVVVFFAGHGFQIGAENYLVPVDADLDNIYDVPFEAVSLSSLVAIVGARARLQVVMLDSCRDNPFAGRSAVVDFGADLREARTGFSSQAAPLNSMLIYSTAPGTVAFDGEGENSPFTAAFIEEVSPQPERLIKEIFEDVRRSVFQRTDGRQVPWESSTLIEPARFGIGQGDARPILVASRGGGQSRGIARLSATPAAAEAGGGTSPTAFSGHVEAEFVPEVAIGPALRDAVGAAPGQDVTVLRGPETGRLMLRGEDGLSRDVEGETLPADRLAELVLVNRSVQIPAVDLEVPAIADSFALRVGDREMEIRLDLAVDPCDFQGGDFLDPDGMGVGRFPYQLDPPAVIEACEAAIEREPNAGRFHYQLGRGLLAERRFHEAEAAYRRARDLGHTRGWHALGLATYMRGFQTGGLSREVPMSEESRALLARGVIEGDPYAMYSLGRDLMRHGTTTVVQIEGYDLMTRAMEVGHTYAMTELARYYLDEESTYHDPERGVRYLQESAARGDIYGMNSLGFSYLDGEGGIVQDKARAAELFATAAEGGHPTAPYNLGLMYFDGDVTGSPAPEEAVALFQTGLERGHALSGAMGAYVIRAAQPEGYDAFDAGVMAAKGAALENSEFAPDALSQLTAMPGQVIDGAAQKLILELGGTLSTVDGAFGPESDRAYAAVLEARGIAASEAKTDPVERAIHLAGLVWDESPFRTDLY